LKENKIENFAQTSQMTVSSRSFLSLISKRKSESNKRNDVTRFGLRLKSEIILIEVNSMLHWTKHAFALRTPYEYYTEFFFFSTASNAFPEIRHEFRTISVTKTFALKIWKRIFNSPLKKTQKFWCQHFTTSKTSNLCIRFRPFFHENWSQTY